MVAMTREDLLRELRALPPTELDHLLRELVDGRGEDPSTVADAEVERAVREVILRYKPALERLARQ